MRSNCSVASWWQDDVDAAIAARERGYVLRRERGETVEAARVAGFLAWDYGAMRAVNALPTVGRSGRVGSPGSQRLARLRAPQCALAASAADSLAGSSCSMFLIVVRA